MLYNHKYFKDPYIGILLAVVDPIHGSGPALKLLPGFEFAKKKKKNKADPRHCLYCPL
jgi:hypothetical protein